MALTNEEIKRTRGRTMHFLYTQQDASDDMSSWEFMFEIIKKDGACCDESQMIKIDDQSRFTQITNSQDLQWIVTRDEQLTSLPNGVYTWRLWRTDGLEPDLLADGPLIIKS